MHAAVAETPMTALGDATSSALSTIHNILIRPASDHPGLSGLLGELAGAFKATAGGLSNLPDGRERFRFPAWIEAEPNPLPWQDDPSLLARAGQAPGAVVIPRSGSSMLATTVRGQEASGWVLWLEDPARTGWSDGEAGALALAGHVLSRWLEGESQPRWAEQLDRAARQQRLETAAAVTRRLAHDFGNVLTGILGFTELALAQQVPSNTPLHAYLNEAFRAAQAGAQLTHQLRLFSRRQSSTSRSCPLTAVLSEQEARLFSAREAGVSLRLNVATDLPAVALDPEHLAHVLSALLDNAREALVGPGSISVSARLIELKDADCQDLFGSTRPGPHVEVIIADTGIGLSPDVQRRLFTEPFFTTKPRRRGFGLAITYGILHAHRAGLRLHPGAERGVVARVLLPIVPVTRPFEGEQPGGARLSEFDRAPEGSRSSAKAPGEKILVVDDEPEVLQIVAASLEQGGFRVDALSNGEAALERYFAATSDPYRLVLTDVLMPGLNGVDLVHRLLKRDPGVHVLFMSAQVSADFTQQDFANYTFELVPKPFRPDHLLRMVRAAIDRPARRFGRDGGDSILSPSGRR
jgi:signal transduction histidine kinase/CheY-like chemotaxis protein